MDSNFEYNDSDLNDSYDYLHSYIEPCDFNSYHNMEITIQTYIYSIIFVFGLFGNIMVIITYAFYKKAKSKTDVYLLNVAIADIMFVLALPLIIYNEHNDWRMGAAACKLLRGAYSLNLYSSMLLLACISSDRYVAIVQARRSFGVRSRSVVYSRIICITIWVLAVILSIPTIMFYQHYEEGVGEEVTFECNFKFGNDQDTSTVRLMKVLLPSMQVSVGFFLPLLVMGFCYSCILITLLQAQNFQKHKAVRVVLAVVIVFVICHLPYNVALLYHTVWLFKERGCESETVKLLVVTVTRSLAYLHCCLNPFLYAFIGVKFRSHFQKILEDLWCQGKKYIYTRRSSKQTSELYVSAPCKEPNIEHQSSFTI